MTQHGLGWTECAEGLRMFEDDKTHGTWGPPPYRWERQLADAKHSNDDGYSKQLDGYAPL